MLWFAALLLDPVGLSIQTPQAALQGPPAWDTQWGHPCTLKPEGQPQPLRGNSPTAGPVVSGAALLISRALIFCFLERQLLLTAKGSKGAGSFLPAFNICSWLLVFSRCRCVWCSF